MGTSLDKIGELKRSPIEDKGEKMEGKPPFEAIPSPLEERKDLPDIQSTAKEDLEEQRGVVEFNEERKVEIIYHPDSPLQDDEEVCILAEFTKWLPEPLQLVQREGVDVFLKAFDLDSGFKYRLRFIRNMELTTDVKLPVSVNSIGY